MTFVLRGQMPSGKNSVKTTRTGQRYPNDRFVAWRDASLQELHGQVTRYRQEVASLPLSAPIKLYCEYVPGDRRVRDVPGILDALCHLIVRAGLLVDDGLVHEVSWVRHDVDRTQPGLSFRMEVLGQSWISIVRMMAKGGAMK